MEVASNTATTGSCLVRTIFFFFWKLRIYIKLLRNCTSYFSRTFFEAKKLLQETAKIFDLKKHSVSYI